jgi:hypothetical protein
LNCNAQINKTDSGSGSLKAEKTREMPQSTGNKRLAEQIRKILGKHYANKYRAGQKRHAD